MHVDSRDPMAAKGEVNTPMGEIGSLESEGTPRIRQSFLGPTSGTSSAIPLSSLCLLWQALWIPGELGTTYGEFTALHRSTSF